MDIYVVFWGLSDGVLIKSTTVTVMIFDMI